MTELGSQINFWRRKNNMTVAELASRMKLKESTIRSWESGQRKPDIDKFAMLLDIFKLDFEELYPVKHPKTTCLQNELERLRLGYMKLSIPERIKLFNILDAVFDYKFSQEVTRSWEDDKRLD